LLAYFCKYAPIEIFEAMGEDVQIIDPQVVNFNQADILMHPNICSFVKGTLEDFSNKEEIRNIARQAYVDNYLPFYDNEIDFDGFVALVMGDIMQKVPANQLDGYNVIVTEDGVEVENK
jgi:hypothetical protein